MRAKGVE